MAKKATKKAKKYQRQVRENILAGKINDSTDGIWRPIRKMEKYEKMCCQT